jgi:hypothetical protein
MMWPRLSKEFPGLASLQLVVTVEDMLPPVLGKSCRRAQVGKQHVEGVAILLIFVNLVDYGLLESSID